MTNEEIVTLIQNGIDRKQNLELLYKQNAGLLQKIANRYLAITTLIEYEDLLQQSYFGLVKAADLWEPGQGASFSTYLVKAVRSELLRYIHENDSVIRMPDYFAIKVYKYKQIMNQYMQQYGVEPSDQFLCERLQISRNQLSDLRSYSLSLDVKSLSDLISEDSDATLEDFIPDESDQYEQAEEKMIQGELAEKLWTAVARLKEDQQIVIRSYYQDEKTMSEIAEDEGIEFNKACRLRDTALRELRHRNSSKLLPYCEIYGIGIQGTGLTRFKRTGTSATEYAALKLLERMENE